MQRRGAGDDPRCNARRGRPFPARWLPAGGRPDAPGAVRLNRRGLHAGPRRQHVARGTAWRRPSLLRVHPGAAPAGVGGGEDARSAGSRAQWRNVRAAIRGARGAARAAAAYLAAGGKRRTGKPLLRFSAPLPCPRRHLQSPRGAQAELLSRATRPGACSGRQARRRAALAALPIESSLAVARPAPPGAPLRGPNVHRACRPAISGPLSS